MAVTKKPKIDENQFIGGAKADTVKTENRDNGIKVKRNKGKTVKMTYYMDQEMYLKWKEYALKQLQNGNKISFQGVIDKYMSRLIKQ